MEMSLSEPTGHDSWHSAQNKTASAPYVAIFFPPYHNAFRLHSSCSSNVLVDVAFELLAILFQIQELLVLFSPLVTQGKHQDSNLKLAHDRFISHLFILTLH